MDLIDNCQYTTRPNMANKTRVPSWSHTGAHYLLYSTTQDKVQAHSIHTIRVWIKCHIKSSYSANPTRQHSHCRQQWCKIIIGISEAKPLQLPAHLNHVTNHGGYTSVFCIHLLKWKYLIWWAIEHFQSVSCCLALSYLNYVCSHAYTQQPLFAASSHAIKRSV